MAALPEFWSSAGSREWGSPEGRRCNTGHNVGKAPFPYVAFTAGTFPECHLAVERQPVEPRPVSSAEVQRRELAARPEVRGEPCPADPHVLPPAGRSPCVPGATPTPSAGAPVRCPDPGRHSAPLLTLSHPPTDSPPSAYPVVEGPKVRPSVSPSMTG